MFVKFKIIVTGGIIGIRFYLFFVELFGALALIMSNKTTTKTITFITFNTYFSSFISEGHSVVVIFGFSFDLR